MKLRSNCKVRNVAGENVIIIQGRAGADLTKVIALNESSLLLWNTLKEKDFTTKDVADTLIQNYGIDSVRAENDANAWVEKLKECDLIE